MTTHEFQLCYGVPFVLQSEVQLHTNLLVGHIFSLKKVPLQFSLACFSSFHFLFEKGNSSTQDVLLTNGLTVYLDGGIRFQERCSK